MSNLEALTRVWVEVAEEGDAERIVLRPVDYPMPPSRGGRRRLDLSEAGQAESLGYGATDRVEAKASGRWSCEGDNLQVDLPGWRGNYLVEEVGRKILILHRR